MASNIYSSPVVSGSPNLTLEIGKRYRVTAWVGMGNLARVKYMVKNTSDATFMFTANTKSDGYVTFEFVATYTSCDLIFQRADGTTTNLYFYLDDVKVEEISEYYRFGFNGKEVDNEVSGNGNSYDYGFRIYNPRLAKFLSVDPLTKTFSMLTPYQFASNSPISGIDLDGLEYLDSDNARVKFTNGILYLRIENMNNPTQTSYNTMNNDPPFWGDRSKNIGVSTEVGKFVLKTITPPATVGADDGYGATIPYLNPYNIKVEGPKTNQSNWVLENRQYYTGKNKNTPRTVSGASARAPLVAKGLLAVDIVNFGLSYTIKYLGKRDNDLIKSHIEYAKRAIEDVEFAMQNTTLIPTKYQNKKDLSNIANVVLTLVQACKKQKLVQDSSWI